MRDFDTLRKYQLSKTELKAFISETEEPVVTQKATDRIIKILDANYQKADLKVVVQQARHLNPRQKEMLYNLLLKYSELIIIRFHSADSAVISLKSTLSELTLLITSLWLYEYVARLVGATCLRFMILRIDYINKLSNCATIEVCVCGFLRGNICAHICE